MALQIGDGDAVACVANGEAFRPLRRRPAPRRRRHRSLCQPSALESLRYTVIDLEVEDVVLAFLCTDGFGGSRVDADGWWQQTGDELVQLGRQHGPTWLAEQLPGWLEEPALVGGDDTTMAILARSDMQVPDTVPVRCRDRASSEGAVPSSAASRPTTLPAQSSRVAVAWSLHVRYASP